MIKVRCPHCDQKLGMPDEYAGHRVRCSKCSQPFAIPKAAPAAQPIIAMPAKLPTPSVQSRVPQAAGPVAAKAQTLKTNAVNAQPAAAVLQTTPSPCEAMDDFEELEEETSSPQDASLVPDEDPRDRAIRLARQQRAKDAAASTKTSKKAVAKDAARQEKAGGLSLADRIPEALRFPIGLAISLVFTLTVIVIWIVAARATSSPLCFVALFVPIAAASGLKLATVNSSFWLALLGTLLGGLGIAAGKAAVAKYVVIPFQQNYVKTEVLTDMPKLLSDPKYQLEDGESVRFIARDGDFLTCIALFSLVDEGKADPVKARQWAFDILRASNKTNIYAIILSALNSAPEVPQLPEITPEDQPMFDMAYERMSQWEEGETELQNARKYFPALNCIASQCETDRLLEKPDTAFKFALLDTLGLFDALWVLMGMGLAYVTLSLD